METMKTRRNWVRRSVILLSALAVMTAVLVTPALAEPATPFHATFGVEDVTEVELDNLPSGGGPGILLTVEADSNLGPFAYTAELPFSTFIYGNANIRWQAIGEFDFGDGNVLYTEMSGRGSFGGQIFVVAETIVGGDGIYSGASGTIHTTEMFFHPQASRPEVVVVRGVIK